MKPDETQKLMRAMARILDRGERDDVPENCPFSPDEAFLLANRMRRLSDEWLVYLLGASTMSLLMLAQDQRRERHDARPRTTD